jgi:hypothetical protein
MAEPGAVLSLGDAAVFNCSICMDMLYKCAA